MTTKNPAAVALGRKGGSANTEAQRVARKENARRAGRPAQSAKVAIGSEPARAYPVAWLGFGTLDGVERAFAIVRANGAEALIYRTARKQWAPLLDARRAVKLAPIAGHVQLTPKRLRAAMAAR